jgi:hypothetical protein
MVWRFVGCDLSDASNHQIFGKRAAGSSLQKWNYLRDGCLAPMFGCIFYKPCNGGRAKNALALRS